MLTCCVIYTFVKRNVALQALNSITYAPAQSIPEKISSDGFDHFPLMFQFLL